MALSNTVIFTETRDQLITDALLDVGAVGLGQAIDADLISAAARKLNMMLKAWQADGLNLWKIRETTLFLQRAQNYYQLGPTSTDNITVDRPIYKSITTAALAINTTTIPVVTNLAQTNPSFSALKIGDKVGIELSDHSMQWTTVSTLPDGISFTIPAPGLTQATLSGATVYAYTNGTNRPLAVWDLMRRDKSDNDVPVLHISRNEMYTFGKKTTLGTPTNFYFNPSIVQGTGSSMAEQAAGSQNAELWTYVSPSTATDRLVFNAQYPVMDMTAANMDFDCPQEWLLGIQTNLSVLLGPGQAITMEQFQILKGIAKEEKDRVMSWDRENTSMFLQPQRRFPG